jgi:competence protein ComEA
MRRKSRAQPERLSLLIFLSWLLVAAQVSCVRLPRRAAVVPNQNGSPTVRQESPLPSLIDINTATREELEKLPGIGEALAQRIIEHREQYGRFRRAEHLLMVRGISERRFRALSPLLTTR